MVWEFLRCPRVSSQIAIQNYVPSHIEKKIYSNIFSLRRKENVYCISYKTELTMLKRDILYIHSAVQSSPLSSSKTFSSLRKETPYPLSNFSLFPPSPSLWQLPVCFVGLWIYLFRIFHINWILKYVTFVSGFFDSA